VHLNRRFNLTKIENFIQKIGGFFMKKLWKLLATFAVIAMLEFALAACQSDNDDSNIQVTGVTLDKESISIVIGDTDQLTETIEPTNADNKNVSWSSSAENVATVKDGTVTAVAAGSAVITVTTEDGGKEASCTITVTEKSSGSEDDDTGDINVEIKF